jgi:hypothetical protein
LQFHTIATDTSVLLHVLQATVVMKDSDRQNFLCPFLTYDVFVEECSGLDRCREGLEAHFRTSADLFFDDLVAQVDAFVADVDTWSCNQLLDLLLGLAAKGALQ